MIKYPASLISIPPTISYSGGGGVAAPAVTYLWRATFTDTDDAPLTTPRTETVGESIAVQANSLLSTNGSALVMSGTPTAINYLQASTAGAARAFPFQAGRVFQFEVNKTSGTIQGAVEVASTPTGNRSGIQFQGGAVVLYEQDTSGLSTFFPIASANGVWWMVERLNGGFFVGKGEKLLWVTRDRTQTSRYAHLESAASGVHDANFPEASVYDVPVGNPFLLEYALAPSRVAAPASGETSTMTANTLLEVTWTPQTNEVLTWLFRRLDDDNTLKLVCDQAAGTLKLYTRTAGVDTEINAGQTHTWTVGTPWRVTAYLDGTTIKTRVNHLIKHSTTSSVQQTSTTQKISSTATPTLTNLIAWPGDVPGFPFV